MYFASSLYDLEYWQPQQIFTEHLTCLRPLFLVLKEHKWEKWALLTAAWAPLIGKADTDKAYPSSRAQRRQVWPQHPHVQSGATLSCGCSFLWRLDVWTWRGSAHPIYPTFLPWGPLELQDQLPLTWDQLSSRILQQDAVEIPNLKKAPLSWGWPETFTGWVHCIDSIV